MHFRLGEALHLPWLVEQIDALPVEGRWHAVARGVLRDELAAQQRALVGQVLAMPGSDADAKVRQWLERDDASLRFTLGDAQRTGGAEDAGLSDRVGGACSAWRSWRRRGVASLFCRSAPGRDRSSRDDADGRRARVRSYSACRHGRGLSSIA